MPNQQARMISIENQQARMTPRIRKKFDEAKRFLQRADVLKVITLASTGLGVYSGVGAAAFSYLDNPSCSYVQAAMRRTALKIAVAAIANGYERICSRKGSELTNRVEKDLEKIAAREAREARAREARAREARARAREARAREARAIEAKAKERRAINSMTRRRR